MYQMINEFGSEDTHFTVNHLNSKSDVMILTNNPCGKIIKTGTA